MEAALKSLSIILDPSHFMMLFAGVLVGLSIGILPGLGGIVGMSILLPIIYGMDPHSAFALLIGMVAVIPTSDTFPSVMMGIPGSSASQATIMDGYPLAKKGEAAARLKAATVVPLDERLALDAADLSLRCKLPLADAVVYATAQAHGAVLVTGDAHFKTLPGVHYIPGVGEAQ